MTEPAAPPIVDYATPHVAAPPRARWEGRAHDVRAAFFLNYAMMGAVVPYAPLLLRERGFSTAEVGYAFAVWSASLILSPVLLTLAADTRADSRRLIALALTVTGASLVLLGLTRGFWPLMAVWSVYCLSSLPLLPLQDGLYFSLGQRIRERGGQPPPYYRVRVWGTIGFIVPSVLLFALLWAGMPVAGALMSGAAFAVLGMLQSFLLEDPRPRRASPRGFPLDGRPGADGAAAEAEAAQQAAAPSRLPTFEAMRVLFRPPVIGFVAAILLGQMAGTLLGPYYPLYLTERAGVPTAWVGLLTNIGVVVEVFFVLAGGWLVAQLGVKGFLLAGLALTGLRMALMAVSDNVGIAVGTQLLHGMQIVTLWVMPQTFLDRHADDRYRNSVQGVFVMLMACGRAASTLVAGRIAAGAGLPAMFAFAAGLCAAGMLVAVFTFQEKRPLPSS